MILMRCRFLVETTAIVVYKEKQNELILAAEILAGFIIMFYFLKKYIRKIV